MRAYKLYGERIFTASVDGTVREWASKTGDLLNVMRGHSGSVNGISFKSGCLYSASDDGTIRCWEFSDPVDEDGDSENNNKDTEKNKDLKSSVSGASTKDEEVLLITAS